jgi:hypothetical protein
VRNALQRARTEPCPRTGSQPTVAPFGWTACGANAAFNTMWLIGAVEAKLPAQTLTVVFATALHRQGTRWRQHGCITERASGVPQRCRFPGAGVTVGNGRTVTTRRTLRPQLPRKNDKGQTRMALKMRATLLDTREHVMPPSGFRTFVVLDSPYLERDGKQYRVSAGMLVSAEVNLGSRTVMEYLLSPVQKTVHEAGREM